MNDRNIYIGMRPGEQAKTERFLRSLEFYPVTREVAQLAGDLFRQWRQKGHSLSLHRCHRRVVTLTYGRRPSAASRIMFRPLRPAARVHAPLGYNSG